MKQLKVCWLSAGVSSFMAGYLNDHFTFEDEKGNPYKKSPIDEWIYIDIDDQHPDSMRFIKDCEKVIGKKITILKSKEYKCIEDCFKVFGGFQNPNNGFAPCTNWMKKRIRKEWEEQHKEYEITYVWGFDLNEITRADRTIEANPQANHEFPLIEKSLLKSEVHGMFSELFSIKRPYMYDLGYPNNNCVGCVKGGMGYWNKIRKDFPEVFERRAKLERQLGHSMLKDKNGPVYLDELDPNRGDLNTEIFPDCGIMCRLNLENQDE